MDSEAGIRNDAIALGTGCSPIEHGVEDTGRRFGSFASVEVGFGDALEAQHLGRIEFFFIGSGYFEFAGEGDFVVAIQTMYHGEACPALLIRIII